MSGILRLCVTLITLSGLLATGCHPEDGATVEYAGTRMTEHAAYAGCIVLENADTRVILGPHTGGRVLEYSWKGTNIILLDKRHDGWVYEKGKPSIAPSGGRFDVGPERSLPSHPTLWLSGWRGEITGPRTAQMSSRKDETTGLQLVRTFELAATGSRLICRQTMINRSAEEIDVCHWGRTLVPAGGTCIIPKSPTSRFPRHFIMHEPKSRIAYWPKDETISCSTKFITVTGTPKRPELGFDSKAGWLAYHSQDGLLFVKKFKVYPKRIYNMMIPITVCVYYGKTLCELEPIGPAERLAPGKSASFEEEWHLLPYRKTASATDPEAVAAIVKSL